MEIEILRDNRKYKAVNGILSLNESGIDIVRA